MNFEAVFKLIVDSFRNNKIDFAVIGGFALLVAGYSRATEDIDLLIPQAGLPKVKKILGAYGFELIHESQDVATFVGKMRELGRVDFLLAHRKYAKAMLERSVPEKILDGKISVKVILPEDLIGLKVQSSSNDPARYHQDMADIEAVMRNNKKLDYSLIREYFALFDRQYELEEIMKRIKNA